MKENLSATFNKAARYDANLYTILRVSMCTSQQKA